MYKKLKFISLIFALLVSCSIATSCGKQSNSSSVVSSKTSDQVVPKEISDKLSADDVITDTKQGDSEETLLGDWISDDGEKLLTFTQNTIRNCSFKYNRELTVGIDLYYITKDDISGDFVILILIKKGMFEVGRPSFAIKGNTLSINYENTANYHYHRPTQEELNTFQAFQKKIEADLIKSACDDIYSNIVAGIVYQDSTERIVTNKSKLPEKKSSITKKKEAGLDCTIQMALEYLDLIDLKENIDKGNYVYDGNAHIYSQTEHPVEESGYSVLTTDTTMRDIGYK